MPIIGTSPRANSGATPPPWSAKNRDRMALSPWRVGGARGPCRFYRSVTTSRELLLKFAKTFVAVHESTRNPCWAISPLCGARIRARRRLGKREIAPIAESHLSRRKGWTFSTHSTYGAFEYQISGRIQFRRAGCPAQERE